MDESPHGEVVNAIATSPDSRQAVVTLEGRLLRYEIASGRLLRVLAAPRGMLRALAWSPDGAQLLVTAFYDHTAHLVRAEDGGEVRAIALDAEGAGVAFAADGPWAAAGTETGPITLVDRTQDGPGRVLPEPQRPSEQLAFVADALVAGGSEGVLWVWDAATGTVRRRIDVGTPILRLSALRGTTIIAIAGQDLALRLYDVERGSMVETLAWHRALAGGLAWAGHVLVSGDVEGKVALWDLGERLAVP
jgi:WD40 repeat protein